MRTAVRSLEGRTALVTGGGTAFGRAIALALSARGVRIVVTGRDEKALGETVGEIVHGGGKARHVPGEGRTSSVLAAAIERAREVFGALDIVIDTELTDVEYTFDATASHLRSPGRVLLVAAGKLEDPAHDPTVVVRERARALLANGITCNAIVIRDLSDGADRDDIAADAGELAVFLCGRAADRITGQAIALAPGS